MYMQTIHSNKSVTEVVYRAPLGTTAVIRPMNNSNCRVSAILGMVLPLILVSVLIHYVLMGLLPGESPNMLSELEGTDRGLVYMLIMLTAGSLLAFAFTNFDRLAGLSTMCPVNGQKPKGD